MEEINNSNNPAAAIAAAAMAAIAATKANVASAAPQPPMYATVNKTARGALSTSPAAPAAPALLPRTSAPHTYQNISLPSNGAAAAALPTADNAPRKVPAWYLKGQSRAELKARATTLQTMSPVGHFFVRDGVQSKGGAYALTVKFPGQVLKNYLIKQMPGKQLRIRGHQLMFSTLQKLVHHYSEQIDADLGVQLQFDPHHFSTALQQNPLAARKQRHQTNDDQMREQQERERQRKLAKELLKMQNSQRQRQHQTGSSTYDDGGTKSDSATAMPSKKVQQIELLAARVVEKLAARERGGQERIDSLAEKVAAHIQAGSSAVESGAPSAANDRKPSLSLAQKKYLKQQRQQQREQEREQQMQVQPPRRLPGAHQAALQAQLNATGRMTDMQRAALMLQDTKATSEDTAPPELWAQNPDLPYQYESERKAAAAVAAARRDRGKGSFDAAMPVESSYSKQGHNTEALSDLQMAARMLQEQRIDADGPPQVKFKSVSHAAASLGNPDQKKDCIIC